MYEAKVLRPGYAYWVGPAQQRADGTITLLRGPKTIIVDTGSPWDREMLLATLEREGVCPEEVDYVVCTHGHSDHTGNNNLFQNATFIVSYDISKRDFYSFHDFASGRPYRIDDDVEVIATSPGHTSEDISVIVRTPDGTVAVVGDLFENEDDLENPSLWQAFSKFPAEQAKNRQRVLEIADFIIPGHGNIFRVPKQAKATRTAPEDIDGLLRSPRVSATISSLALQFQTHIDRVNEEKIRSWLRQFGSVRWVELALKLLQHVDYYDEGRIGDTFYDFYTELMGQENDFANHVAFTILGGYQDSSTKIIYHCSKALAERGSAVELGQPGFQNLQAIVRERLPTETIVVFVDDILGSGGQATQIFSGMIGLTENHETGLELLSPNEVAWLRASRLVLFVLVGFEEGIQHLVEYLRAHGLPLSVHAAVKTREDFRCFQARSGIFLDRRDREEAESMAMAIGYQLLADKQHWPEETRRQRALGYGNSQKLIVFSYNTPTCTLPILWKQGYYEGRHWSPIFPRRD